MSDLASWLDGVHGEVERIARAAAAKGTPQWHDGGDEWTVDAGRVVDMNGDVVVYDEGRPFPEEVAHIALHDPASALARVEAERAIAERHQESEATEVRHGNWEGHGGDERWIRYEPNECPVCREPEPCYTMRALAWGWPHMRGWQEEWKPSS